MARLKTPLPIYRYHLAAVDLSMSTDRLFRRHTQADYAHSVTKW